MDQIILLLIIDVVEGADGVWQQNNNSGIYFIINNSSSEFTGATVDGIKINADCLAISDKTMLVLNSDYLQTLDVGSHTLHVSYIDGYAQTTFTVVPQLIPTCKITFYADDTEHAVIVVDKGSSIGDMVPDDPELKYHNFLGWYTEAGSKIDASTILLKDMSVYAEWEADESYVEVTFVIDGNAYQVEKLKKGMISAPEVSSQDGKEFNGWYLDEKLQNKFDFGSEVTESITLYAEWDEEESSHVLWIIAAAIIIVAIAAVIWCMRR